MTVVHKGGWKERNDNARALVTQRFLDAAEKEPDPFEGPIGFPARINTRNIRPMPDNSLSVILNIEDGFWQDLFSDICRAADKPIAITLDVIPLPDADA